MSLAYSRCKVAAELQRERSCKYVLYSTAEMYFIPNAVHPAITLVPNADCSRTPQHD